MRAALTRTAASVYAGDAQKPCAYPKRRTNIFAHAVRIRRAHPPEKKTSLIQRRQAGNLLSRAKFRRRGRIVGWSISRPPDFEFLRINRTAGPARSLSGRSQNPGVGEHELNLRTARRPHRLSLPAETSSESAVLIGGWSANKCPAGRENVCCRRLVSVTSRHFRSGASLLSDGFICQSLGDEKPDYRWRNLRAKISREDP